MSEQLYLAMAGARETLISQTIHSNNLANASTPGFRADLYNAQSLELLGDSASATVYNVSGKPNTDFTPGTIMTTDRDLDVAIKGQGWFVVQNSEGKEAYTRAGSFQLNANGQLTTTSGKLVMGNGGAIALPPSETMTIANDGTISVRPIGQSATTLAVVDRLKLVNPEQSNLQKGADGLFYLKDDTSAAADPNVQIVSRALESSNVNAVDSMLNIIAMARQFEFQMKIMQDLDQNGDLLAQLLQTS